MNWLKDFFVGLFQAFWKYAGPFMRAWWRWGVVVLLGPIFAPIVWFLDIAIKGLDYVTDGVNWMGEKVAQLELDRIAGLWGQIQYYVDLANTIAPMDVIFSCVAVLMSLKLFSLAMRFYLKIVMKR